MYDIFVFTNHEYSFYDTIRFLEFQPFDSLVRTETLMDLGCAERLHKFLSLVGSAGDVGLMDCSWLKLPVGRDPNPWTHTNSLFLRHMTSRTVCDQEYLQILVEGRRFSQEMTLYLSDLVVCETMQFSPYEFFVAWDHLGGGFNHFLFVPLLGEMIQFD